MFLQVLQNKEMLRNAENQLNITRENIARRKELIEAGKLAEGEIFEIQAQEAKEELARVQAENQLKLSLLDLSQVLELDHFEDIDVAVPKICSKTSWHCFRPMRFTEVPWITVRK